MPRPAAALSELARLGFAELGEARDRLAELSSRVPAVAELLPAFASSADPDSALLQLERLVDRDRSAVESLLTDGYGPRLVVVLGASSGLGDFVVRRPAELEALRDPLVQPPSVGEYTADLLESVGERVGDEARVALRVRYRRHLLRLASFDLDSPDPLAVLPVVATALADLAGAALDAGLAVARREVAFPAEDVDRTRLAIIGMGKAGARELNYLSDVDVVYVAEGADGLENGRAVEIATRLAVHTVRVVSELSLETELWEVDANLRPEGQAGALVRTLESHVAYYERWAKGWEFQALLKARPLAGDTELGDRYVERVAPFVWAAASRENFVESVQRMRERVTDLIPADEVDRQLKLGPGGLRDIEFTIQLLQLVHGQADDGVRQRATLDALGALARRGYVGRAEAAEFDRDYRLLRLLEHRIQLSRLRRTHLMPVDEGALRVLARSSRLGATAAELVTTWHDVRRRVRTLHERLFYRPLLSAVAARPEEELALSSDQAAARLAVIGFVDPRGALGHIAALTAGVSRRASIQRHLLPAMLQWFADGTDPDLGLLAFRRLSDGLGESYWFLRMLRDSSGAAHRLTTVLSSSRFVADLLDRIPEAAAWFENDHELRPRPLASLLDEARATVARHSSVDAAAAVLRQSRRREILRLAMGGILGLLSIDELARGLSAVTTAAISGTLALARRDAGDLEFAVIAMGRYGGEELGFGSDADVLYVYRAEGDDGTAHRRALAVVAELNRLTSDALVPLDLDTGLRPEGKNGTVARSLSSYRAYYARWSLTWEAQSLLRARPVAGDEGLAAEFMAVADGVRYPEAISDQEVREVKRIKARVEAERLPKGAEPSRHLKLGRGSLSDVEWYVQLLQLQHAHDTPGLRTPSTLEALAAAAEAGLLSSDDAQKLRDAWTIASRARSAVVLWTSRTSDVLPTDRRLLEGVARLMEYPPGSATRLEEDYLAATRRSRAVFERGFYGLDETPEPTG
ncbi:bifunctional [glutamine synthetase] adenylyltransferase/[glutamine synthetase]-adenylyl-L-tyrosine phosphorylase [Frigoribacterium sp. CFBP9039]|uniref:bifunctional [glutamine synthetase] adenylyltransferase/[glutamine synthetase]-adenylyl-L-tyrosine phosphorylase n=1 Tax=unclassified Frigoribacterium TaxID=2627005 RepID=UPI002A69D0B9|nr:MULTISPECIES: bifunctional [glutamine synthetase] adenylyltransferase/[glutamine synthetase]-adenylyl-L-tyrosine phosphorylase [unclassified Frigoribacterium]MDY0892951.1 bifunctional [glutamine synthetase] adenylyltransferase/[glutamine synthetase]-adenylyl-L-tyrosine phosphorylase [Frigoribacterium sp. CFBP9030]MDY0944915.1 bifunctional [glutamine synthetase] adenylyltransferase/[glutamine synthetase]-adenylyl-L-tyrosine phosphorylase [Frigoribacterium sp. CFBP9039]